MGPSSTYGKEIEALFLVKLQPAEGQDGFKKEIYKAKSSYQAKNMMTDKNVIWIK